VAKKKTINSDKHLRMHVISMWLVAGTGGLLLFLATTFFSDVHSMYAWGNPVYLCMQQCPFKLDLAFR